MTRLKVTPEEVKKVAGDITSEIQSLADSFKNIDTEVNGTKKYWQGDASDKHIKDYSEVKAKADELMNKLKEAPVALAKIAGFYVEAEQANQQVASALPDDIF